MTKRTNLTSSEHVKGRIRPALRSAIRLIIEEGYTQADAAKSVGMNQVSLSLALRKPHVAALRAAVKRAWLDSETSKAWLTMADLMRNATSEDIRLKAAKVFLEQGGELEPERDASSAPRSLVQILINHPVGDGAEINASHPGVIEIVQSRGRLPAPYLAAEER